MNKKIKTIIIIQFIIIIISVLLIKVFMDIRLKKENDKFDYENAKTTTIRYLNTNEKELKKIVDELYNNKSSVEKPLKKIIYASYYYDDYFNFKKEEEYVKLDIDAKGMLGGQYYGLIYSKNNNEELIKNKETRGNNIFIRQKIKDNWYFYYNDYDGKININKIKE